MSSSRAADRVRGAAVARVLLSLTLAAAPLAGCASGSSDSANGSSASASGSSASASAATPSTAAGAPHARPPHHRRAPAPARARGKHSAARSKPPSRLPASTVDSHTVARQPPPGSCHAGGAGRFPTPDPHCTPGAIDPVVTQASIDSTICVPGYTRTVRPPESVTNREKLASMAAYGDHDSPHGYEYDHLVSLELGGARNDPRNLWPEPGASPNVKDKLESRLHAMVCAGRITLAVAQREIATKWVATYRQLFG